MKQTFQSSNERNLFQMLCDVNFTSVFDCAVKQTFSILCRRSPRKKVSSLLRKLLFICLFCTKALKSFLSADQNFLMFQHLHGKSVQTKHDTRRGATNRLPDPLRANRKPRLPTTFHLRELRAKVNCLSASQKYKNSGPPH